MTRKDYQKIAAVIAQAKAAHETPQQWASGCDSAREYIASHLENIFAEDNPRFDRDRFMQDCGLE